MVTTSSGLESRWGGKTSGHPGQRLAEDPYGVVGVYRVIWGVCRFGLLYICLVVVQQDRLGHGNDAPSHAPI
eukprot:4142489-Lingulodinium_polyedra.AAC.1